MTAPKKEVSEARLRANRANALKSTGPRTTEGKARSARNATTHGLTSKDITALGEDRTALASTVQAFLVSWDPATPYEASLIEDLAALKVRLNRCVRMETGLLDMEIREAAPTDSHESINAALATAFANRDATFIKFSRYESSLSRAYYRTLKELLAVRKARLQPTTQIPSLLDETNPMPLENNGHRLPPEPSSPAANRRHGRLVPLPNLSPRPSTLTIPAPAQNRQSQLPPAAPNSTPQRAVRG